MLPSDPVQQLPLLPATHTAATSRVAAWLLDAEGAAGGAADGAAGGVEPAVPPAAHRHDVDCDSGDDCADLALLHLHDALDEAATEVRLKGAGGGWSGGEQAWRLGVHAAASTAAPGSLERGS